MFSRKVRNKCQKNYQNLLFLFLISIVLSLAGIHVFLLHTGHRFLRICHDFADRGFCASSKSLMVHVPHNSRCSNAGFL